MEYIEQVKTTKTYDVTIDIDDFINWLDGEDLSYENLLDYLSEGQVDYNLVQEEEEEVIHNKVLNYKEFLKEVEDAIKSRN